MKLRKIARGVLARFPLLDGLFRRCIWSRVHFPEDEMRFLAALPRGSIDVAVDIGAAMGAYAFILNRISRRVYAFEPGEVHYRNLARATLLSRIEVVRSAVGNTSGQVSLYTPGSDTHARHSATLSSENPVIHELGTRVDQVRQVSLDAFLGLRLGAGSRVDLLKVDVEGYEGEVFAGAGETLSKHHPLVICEIEARHNSRYAEVFVLLRGLGYECYVFRNGTFELFTDPGIESLQLPGDLEIRLGGARRPGGNRYINNFVFQHPLSRILVSQ